MRRVGGVSKANLNKPVNDPQSSKSSRSQSSEEEEIDIDDNNDNVENVEENVDSRSSNSDKSDNTQNITNINNNNNNNNGNNKEFDDTVVIDQSKCYVDRNKLIHEKIFPELENKEDFNMLKDIGIYRDPSTIDSNKPFKPLLSNNKVSIIDFYNIYEKVTDVNIFAQDFIDYLDLMYYKIEKTTPVGWGYYSTLTSFMCQLLEIKGNKIAKQVSKIILKSKKISLENKFVRYNS